MTPRIENHTIGLAIQRSIVMKIRLAKRDTTRNTITIRHDCRMSSATI